MMAVLHLLTKAIPLQAIMILIISVLLYYYDISIPLLLRASDSGICFILINLCSQFLGT